MARRIVVRVLTFSLGFGPKLFSFRRGDTEYCVSAIPLGGYLKMAGENPKDGRTGAPDEFLSKSKWERFQVLIMGPVMNLALAVVLMAIVLYQGAEVPAYEDQPAVIGAVASGSIAEKGDIRPGDRVLNVSGKTIDTWENFYIAIGTKPYREVKIELERNGERLTRAVTPLPAPNSKYEIGDIGAQPTVRPKLAGILPDTPAARAGLKAGDIILATN